MTTPETKKYIEYRINKISVQRREKFGDWEDLAEWNGKGIIVATTLNKLINEIRKYFKMVVSKL